MRLYKITFILCCIIWSQAQAVSKVSLEDVNIVSNQLILQKSKNLAIFSGSVIVHFQDICLKSEKIEVSFSEDNKVERIIIPVRLSALRNSDVGEEVVIADRGEFVTVNGELILQGNVVAKMGNDILTTTELVYRASLSKKPRNP